MIIIYVRKKTLYIYTEIMMPYTYQTITKTAANTNEALSPGAVSDKMHDNNKQISKGPHRSPETYV